MRPVYVIAEAGVNHNGDVELARSLVDCAAEAGADAVKFQTFRASALATAGARQASYQQRNVGAEESQHQMLSRLELAEREFGTLAEHCRARGIEFLSTPFDIESVELVRRLGVRVLKYPSGEVTNPLLLRACAAAGLPILLSTGMCSLGEVEGALGVLAAAWLEAESGTPSTPVAGFRSCAGQRLLRERVTLLHCTTEYPAPFDEVNLRAMKTMRSSFQLPVGYSDHTPGIAVSIAAVALGAVVLEKHFTLDRSLPGPDHKASLEPGELRDLVRGVREVSAALGDGVKRATASEVPNIAVARRSLVAARAIAAGERFTAENLTAKRPGSGVSAMHFDRYVGRLAVRSYAVDELIDE